MVVKFGGRIMLVMALVLKTPLLIVVAVVKDDKSIAPDGVPEASVRTPDATE